jgi:hypothetical protein
MVTNEEIRKATQWGTTQNTPPEIKEALENLANKQPDKQDEFVENSEPVEKKKPKKEQVA